MAATGRFSETASRTATDSLSFAIFLDSAMDVVEVHVEFGLILRVCGPGPGPASCIARIGPGLQILSVPC